MRKQPYTVLDLTGGEHNSKDAMFLLDKESPNLRNFRIHQNMLRKDVGWTEFGDNLPLDGVPMWIDTFYNYAGSEWLLVVTDSWIYWYNPTTETFVVVSPASVSSGSISVTFTASSKTIGRASGSFFTDGFSTADSITTSSGTNPGFFTVTNIAYNGITKEGSELAMGGGFYSVCHLDSDDIAYYDATNAQLRCYRWGGASWSLVGAGFGIAGAGHSTMANMTSTDIAYYDDTIESLRCYRFNGAVWALVGAGFGIAGTLDPTICEQDSTTIAFYDTTLESLRRYTFNGANWALVGAGLAIGGTAGARIAKLSSTMVAFVDETNHELRCYEYSGGNWANIGTNYDIGTLTNIHMCEGDEDGLILLADGYPDKIYECYFDGSTWDVGEVDDLTVAATYGDLCYMGSLNIAFMDSDTDDLTYYTLGGEAITVSETIVDESATAYVNLPTELTGGEDNPFSGVITVDDGGDDVYFLTNGVDELMRWEGTGNFEFVTDVYVRRLAVFQNRLILGDTTEGGSNCPKRIRWSDIADPDTLPAANFFDLIDTVDWITQLLIMKDRLFVVKERSIWEVAYVGGTQVFKPVLKLDGVGSFAPNACIALGESILFNGSDNFYFYNGLNLDPIADALFSFLYDTEEKQVSSTDLYQSTSLFVEELMEYWVTLPTKGARASILAKYNLAHESWFLKDVVVSALGYYSVSSRTAWQDLSGTWAAQDFIWMTKALPSGAPTTLIGTPDGYIYEDDRITRDTDYAVFETKDFLFAHACRWVEFRIDAKGGEFNLSYSTDGGDTWSTTRTATVDADEFEIVRIGINVTSARLRCKIETYAEDLTIRWIEPWYIPRQRIAAASTAI